MKRTEQKSTWRNSGENKLVQERVLAWTAPLHTSSDGVRMWIQTLRAFRRPNTGGLEVWGEWGIGRLGEEQGLVKLDAEERSKSQANTGAKLSRTCWCFIRILMHLDQNYWKICLGRRLGGPKSQKMLPRPGAASKIEDRGVSRLPQGSWKLSPDWPKRGQGEAN